MREQTRTHRQNKKEAKRRESKEKKKKKKHVLSDWALTVLPKKKPTAVPRTV